MSTTRNPDAVEPGTEIQPRKPRDEPMMKGGHAPGVLVGNDKVPEFQAQTFPPGTAPKENTFQPNPIDETPGQANNPDAQVSGGGATGALDHPGSTSADVHTGYGHPGSGEVASDRSHKGGGGLQGSGMASGVNPVSERENPNQRALERETGDRAGKDTVSDTPSATEQLPQTAEGVAAERSGREKMDRGT